MLKLFSQSQKVMKGGLKTKLSQASLLQQSSRNFSYAPFLLTPCL